ncbi:hypothetical protein GCM10010246_19940 [Streptomyces cuspidosporus]|uniref:Transposase DDE domain-containing protein n=1 Tax=Streptomyces cuspidosporus TaxID=66882 RepID=A0ABN3FRT2_9ACTN
MVLALLVVLLRARIISLASGTPRNRGHLSLQRAGKPGKARREYLKRGFGFRRTRLRRLTGAQTWAGLGIFAYNLHRMTLLSR